MLNQSRDFPWNVPTDAIEKIEKVIPLKKEALFSHNTYLIKEYNNFFGLSSAIALQLIFSYFKDDLSYSL